jgi:hypothetical protein
MITKKQTIMRIGMRMIESRKDDYKESWRKKRIKRERKRESRIERGNR